MRIIFHMPEDFLSGNDKGPTVRPRRMLAAFKSAGIDVFLIAGWLEERVSKFRELEDRLSEGEVFDFMYSESSSYPTLWTETKKTFFGEKVDYKLFKLCKANGIKIGLYLRDIYWVSEQFKQKALFHKQLAYKIMHEIDLFYYKKYVDVLYLQSELMALSLPHREWFDIKVLPPGIVEEQECGVPVSKDNSYDLTLFYVGGLGSHYDMSVVFNVLKDYPMVRLIFCCREFDIKKWGNPAEGLENVEIIHKSSHELAPYIAKSDACLLYFEPNPYRKFVMPNKLYEYIGFRKPVITSDETEAGRYIKSNDLGWAIPYDEKAFFDLLDNLLKHKMDLSFINNSMELIIKQDSWEARILKIVKDLS